MPVLVEDDAREAHEGRLDQVLEDLEVPCEDFINFSTMLEAQKALKEAKDEPAIKAMMDPKHNGEEDYITLYKGKDEQKGSLRHQSSIENKVADGEGKPSFFNSKRLEEQVRVITDPA